MFSFLTYQFRIKDSSEALVRDFNKMASAANIVWNFCNETQIKSAREHRKKLSKFDLQKLTGGSSKELGISSTTIQSICEEYATRRDQFRKSRLRWRSKKSLLWIPFKASAISVNSILGTAKYYGLEFKFWNSRRISGEIRTGSISSDARGRLYLNITCKLPDADLSDISGFPHVGIDLGLKDAAVVSTGVKYKAPRYFRQYQNKLAISQRANKKKQTRNIHAKIANSRKDFNHKISTEITSTSSAIFVGDVNSTDMIQKNMAKSVYDVSWFQLKSFLKYKALARKIPYYEVNEAYSTQICSECGCIGSSSPKGVSGLSIREWSCTYCHAKHDRDINAARNILRFGHESLARQSSRQSLVVSGILGL